MLGILILAAGRGTRMQMDQAKVLVPFAGEPMIFPILRSVKKTTPDAHIGIVVGHQKEAVEKAIRDHAEWKDLDISFIEQPVQRGTGDAARVAMDSPWGQTCINEGCDIVVLPGDLPLIPPNLIQAMAEPLGRMLAMRLLTTKMCEPTGYGRVVRRGKRGPVLRIVEEKDANEREKQIEEVATSIYSFRAAFLKQSLNTLSNKNAQGEFYLTDVLAKAVRLSKKVDVLEWGNMADLIGINSPWDLTVAEKEGRLRLVKAWAEKGVRFIDKDAVWVDAGVALERGCVIEPNVYLKGKSTIGPNVRIKMGTVIEDSVVEEGAQVGPYAHLRPGCHVGKHAKVGNFVELKKTTLGDRTSVAHLSYLGDATVGTDVNIGCGFVTCNFDGQVREGQRKHRTVIEDQAFIGSDCQVVAPLTVGRGAYIASGSTITEDVEPDALAIARARQTTKPGYAKRLRPTS